MNWIYNIKSKMTAALLLFTVLGVVIIINFSERSNSTKINKAISSIYEDRLVVGNYIFQDAQYFQKITHIIENPSYSISEKQEHIAASLAKISDLNMLYSKTKLTEEEKLNFDKFTSLCKEIAQTSSAGSLSKVKELSSEAVVILHNLSSIQISEAKLQMESANSLYNFSNLSSHFEIAILVIIALIIQALVFSSKAVNSIKAPKQFNLN
ncbi:MCP four helix bundle domain-containing protein [Flavobacterium cerinum]|uniref:Chemotaxis methyl-accepting receptor HlyB-like 4HB MCP domain-containing protein n=1 Tax=Flavobacterium cerinum TaxID=2502784 RepID=A0A3S3SDN7_9FLAO|nr:MCP four helix bundle domain-containing protein [Flavobacterium cerinum]RWW98835.1 hypothetical protein EPI11_12985 [Flavobacterium cerinum]